METEFRSSFIPNPEVPCSIPIEDGLFAGRSVRIHGVAHHGADAFWINLQNGGSFDAEDSVAFHIRFIFDDNERAVRWSDIVDDEWGVEVRDAVNPLQEEVNFEIIIVCQQDAVKVYIDGVPYCQFHPRTPLQAVSHVVVQGALTLTSISFEGDYDSALVTSDDEADYELSPTQEIVDSSPSAAVGRPSTAPSAPPAQPAASYRADPAAAAPGGTTPSRTPHISISRDNHQESPISIMTTAHLHALKAARSSTVAFPDDRASDAAGDEELRRRQQEDRKRRLSAMRMSVQESSERFTAPRPAPHRTAPAYRSDLERSKCCVIV